MLLSVVSALGCDSVGVLGCSASYVGLVRLTEYSEVDLCTAAEVPSVLVSDGSGSLWVVAADVAVYCRCHVWAVCVAGADVSYDFLVLVAAAGDGTWGGGAELVPSSGSVGVGHSVWSVVRGEVVLSVVALVVRFVVICGLLWVGTAGSL